MRADVDDHTVTLEPRAVFDDRRLVSINDGADDIFPTIRDDGIHPPQTMDE